MRRTKSMNYTNRLLVTIITIAVSSIAYPCFDPTYGKDFVKFFQVTDDTSTVSDNTRTANLRLWQQQTSEDITLTAIEEIVYGDFDAESWNERKVSDSIRKNSFYKWIRNNKATDIQNFLTLAKRVERCRADKCSPWYYPAKKTNGSIDCSFATLIEQCSEYKNGRLHERYGLQMIRLLHASCQYEECVAAFNEYFNSVPDDNLMKRMAMSYVAGAWTRLGDTDKANKYFAMNGDMKSLNGVDPFVYMVEVNPVAVSMHEMEHLIWRSQIDLPLRGKGKEYVKDTILNVAYKVLRTGKAQNVGDWEFLVAYIEGEFNGNYNAANQHINSALSHKFSTLRGRDHARAYKMAVDGHMGHFESLLDDLKWLESIAELDDSHHWRDVMDGIVYGHWFEYLIEHNHLPMAILLSNYVNSYVTFGLMVNLKPQDIIDYKNFLDNTSSTVAYLRERGCNDDDYLNEIIGTLYMREGNYIEAYNWLSKVSPDYQNALKIYKNGYLKRDPFAFTPASRTDSTECKKAFPKLRDTTNIKLHFAAEMCRLEQEMKHAENSNDRALSTIKYALARYASFTTCWALTSYAYGIVEIEGCVVPDKMSVLFYNWDIGSKEKELMHDMVADALASIKDDVVAAEAQYLLGNLKTVARKYPDTPTGKFLSTHCDNWKDWK